MSNENPADQEQSIKEQRINSIKSLYYSKPEVQRAIFDFSSNREVVPRYFEGFGKRPDSLQYPGDIFPMVQRGATSFHCSIELWQDSLSLSTGQTREKITKLTIGSKYVKDFSASEKVMPDIILVSSRHLFRMPYSLHEKTALASIVIDENKISV